MPRVTSEKRFWFLALAVFIGLFWLLRPILLPFVAGLALAYFLDPVVNALTKRGVPRVLGALCVLIGFILLFVLTGFLIAPLVEHQITNLITAIPSLIDQAKAHLRPFVDYWSERLSENDMNQLQTAAGTYAGSAVGWASDLAKGIVTKSFALFDILTLIVVTPVVAFYLMRDWMKLKQTVDGLLPRHHRAIIHTQIKAIDRALSGFLRGQALVCLCLGLIYGVGLTLTGLQYGATIGLIAGVLTFMPYVGSSFCLISSLSLAFVQFGFGPHIGAVFAVFLFGQSLEGYVLTPKLVGDRVGLHPVWILFALFTGGSLLGFLGVLIAVPVAAASGVLIRFAAGRYRASKFFREA